MAKELQKDYATCLNWTHITLLTATYLNHWAIDLYQFKFNKRKILLLTSCNLETFFFMPQDCCSQIAEVEYQGQTLYTRILDCKPLSIYLIALDIVDWSWNVFSLYTATDNFCLMPIEQLKFGLKMRIENLKFRTKWVANEILCLKQIKPLQRVGQAAELKFESNF